MEKISKRASDDPRVFALFGYAIIIFCFGILGAWAAMAPLGSAVVASGTVTAEGNTKTVQHLEGGIVSEILVHQGDHVQEGQLLIRLDDTQPKANLEIARNQLYAAVAREARLDAEVAGRSEVEFSKELMSTNDPVAAKAMDDQVKQFDERRATILGQISILKSRADQLRQEMLGLDRLKAANEEQVKFIMDELEGVRGLMEKSLVPKSRWAALERERARLEGEIGRSISDRAKAEKGLGENELQMSNIKQQFLEQASRDLVDTREKLRDLRNRYVVAQDVLRRLGTYAPTTGRVQNLRVFTIGGVVRPGEALLEIAPDRDKLLVQARVSAIDIQQVSVGKSAEVRFPAFKERLLPMIASTVVSLSQDRLIDEVSKQPYYLALVDVPDGNLPPQYRGKLTPGMMAEIIIPTRERTVLDYLLEPLYQRLRSTFREH